jgi:hypothetical protein
VAGPENRINPEFTYFVNKYHKVMTENFAECFIDHRNIGLTSQTVAKFTFHHGERGFNIAPLVIMGHKVLSLELEIVKHLFPSSAASAFVMRSKRDVRHGSEARGAP